MDRRHAASARLVRQLRPAPRPQPATASSRLPHVLARLPRLTRSGGSRRHRLVRVATTESGASTASQEAFLRDFHAEHPAVTTEAFSRGRAPDGRSSYEILRDRVAGSRRVLDLGCGDGLLLELLARTDGRQLAGLDLSAESLRLARRRPQLSRARLEQGRAQDLPFPDAVVRGSTKSSGQSVLRRRSGRRSPSISVARWSRSGRPCPASMTLVPSTGQWSRSCASPSSRRRENSPRRADVCPVHSRCIW
ncbi:class I SAM-dependent methyltransferase [Streptomyces sp. NPDC001793]|uniref:class I SAM-dependent methyltransferase n=1 Tax=Streptomyces sp. NPDC001793 TaxID=3154657 RepID=UPI00332B928C